MFSGKWQFWHSKATLLFISSGTLLLPINQLMSVITWSRLLRLMNLRGTQSTHMGYLVIDNLAVFTNCSIMKKFSLNGVKHLTSAWYYPAKQWPGWNSCIGYWLKWGWKIKTGIQNFFTIELPHIASTTGTYPATLWWISSLKYNYFYQT